MIIEDETKDVQTGDAVFIPSHLTHGIRNIGDSTLTYLTANKAFGVARENDIWPEEA